MPQPKKKTSSAKPRSAAATKRSAAAKRAATTRKTNAAKRSTAARKGAAKRSSSSRGGTAQSQEAVRANVQAALDALNKGVVITRDRLAEAMDEAVERGRITRTDANELLDDLIKRGRKQTDDLRKQAETMRGDIEQLLATGLEQIESATRAARRAPAADRALREVDKVRRASGIGGNFPILGYDDLTASQITERVADLTAAQLRKVRDYERRNANRKSVLSSIEKALA